MKPKAILAFILMFAGTAIIFSTMQTDKKVVALESGNTYSVNTVVDAVDSNIGDGICQTSSGGCSLRAAIQEANASFMPALISLPAGDYIITLEGTGEGSAVTGDLDILSNVTLEGEGSDVTTIDANLLDRAFDVGASGQFEITGVKIINGVGDGGAIRNSGILTLTDSLLTGNSGGYGGAVYQYSGQALIGNVQMLNNSSHSRGGALTIRWGNMTIRDSLFENNTARLGSGGALGLGSVCYSTPPNVTIENTHITNNVSENYSGGGISLHCTGNITLRNVSINNNFAPKQRGGGIQTFSSNLNIYDSVIFNNYALTGGGVSKDSSNVFISNSTISNNYADGHGGGLYVECCGPLTFVNTTISNNIADFNENDSGDGGGIYKNSVNSNNTPVYFQNTILAGNSDLSIAAVEKFPDCWGEFTSQQNNLIGINYGCASSFANGVNSDQVGTAVSPLDPMLDQLRNNGGNTLTHALLLGSPAIDAANDGNCPVTDQRGSNRPYDGDVDGDAVCDIGAYEGPVVDLSISLTMGQTTISIGQFVSYELYYANLGTQVANDVTITNIVPSILDNVVYTSSDPSITTIGNDTFMWAVGNLSPGASASITIHGTVSHGSEIPVNNTASIESISGNDQFAGNNDSSVSITVLSEAKIYLPAILSP